MPIGELSFFRFFSFFSVSLRTMRTKVKDNSSKLKAVCYWSCTPLVKPAHNLRKNRIDWLHAIDRVSSVPMITLFILITILTSVKHR